MLNPKDKRQYKLRRNDCNIKAHRIELLNEPQTIEYAINKLVDVQEEQLKNKTTLCALKKEKAKVDKALDNIADSIENGMASKTTAKRLKELEEKQEMLEEQIAIAESKQAAPLSKNQIKAFYAEALKLESRMLIEYLVQEVIAYDDKIEIIFKSPLNTIPDESRGFLLCKKNFATNQISLRSEKHNTVDIGIWIG